MYGFDKLTVFETEEGDTVPGALAVRAAGVVDSYALQVVSSIHFAVKVHDFRTICQAYVRTF
jgi:hypothetical protein